MIGTCTQASAPPALQTGHAKICATRGTDNGATSAQPRVLDRSFRSCPHNDKTPGRVESLGRSRHLDIPCASEGSVLHEIPTSASVFTIVSRSHETDPQRRSVCFAPVFLLPSLLLPYLKVVEPHGFASWPRHCGGPRTILSAWTRADRSSASGPPRHG